ncbi:hypothetical protein [Butyrivibrio sp. YAB3001]|uniref:hypothetical protein n=1 Tax=Butyrivibrio sp. YAB3001 TaxID=1520812 RepID=UPI00158820C0|nr:hypothetical protein [Butyrivibrio sp. YAB3001]
MLKFVHMFKHYYIEEYFDAIVSVDAYHYFGCKEGIFSEKVLPYVKAREVLKYPEDYFMPCFIGIGRPLKGIKPVRQIEINPQDRIHWNEY